MRTAILAVCCLLAASVPARHALASGFTSFAEDEDVCRHVGELAIKGESGPSAAHRYDDAHARCMQARGQQRMMDAYSGAANGAGPRTGNPLSFGYPDAFYSIPYATPGYGYDGFSY